MLNQIAPVKNVSLLMAAGKALATRAPGVPGIGLVWGPTGFGKSTAAVWFSNQVNAVNIRACATWTPSAMLGALCDALALDKGGSCAGMLDRIIERVLLEKRPVIVDEADYLVKSTKLIETLRDLHDLSSSPLVLIGMADFRRKVQMREQLAGRVMQWVEFKACDLTDSRTLAETVCRIEVADDLLEELHRSTRGEIRGLRVGLARIEDVGRRTGKQKMTAKDWGRQEFTLRTPGQDA